MAIQVTQRVRSVFSVIVEIYAGEGGTDSKLFMVDLLTAYLKMGERYKLESEIIYSSDSSVAVQFQRVPPTEARGRRHTSVVSVAVMEANLEIDVSLDLREVEITTMHTSIKAGGQNANKVESAVRAVHRPTGITVRIDGRDQGKNKVRALAILESRVAQLKTDKVKADRQAQRREQIDDCGRSGKVRTYNFIDCTVTDHRRGTKTKKIKEIMKGQFELLKKSE